MGARSAPVSDGSVPPTILIIDDEPQIRRVVKNAFHGARAQKVLELRKTHGSFAGWLAAHHPRSKEEWIKLFKKTFRFTGGEIVGEFLMSIGYLPGAHAATCPVYRTILKLDPMWARQDGRARTRAARAGVRRG